MPPPRFTDSPDLIKPTRPVFTDSPDVAVPKRQRPVFTDSPDVAPARRTRPVFTDSPDVAPASTTPKQPAASTPSWPPQGRADIDKPLPAPVVGERVRQQFVAERAASGLRDITQALDPKARQALIDEAEDTAWAERVGQERYPGGPIIAGTGTAPKPLGRETPGSLETPEARFALDKFRKEREVASRGGDPDEAFAAPRTLPSGRRVVGEPSFVERAGQVAALPVTVPLGAASELYRQTKQTITGEPQAEGFLPPGDEYGTNIGRNIAALPAALGTVAVRKGEQMGQAIAEKGFNRALYEGLGLDRDPVSMPGEASAAKGEDWGESVWRGLKRIPSEIGDIATGFTQLGVAGAEALGSLGTPEGSIEDVAQRGLEGVQEVGAGAFRSFARTALDPRAEFERGPIGTLLNAAMAGQGVRKLAEPITDASAARTAKLTRELDATRAETAPLAAERQSLYVEADDAARQSARTKDALDAMDARIETAERTGKAIDESAYAARDELGKRFAADEARVREARRAVEVFEGPSAKTEQAAQGWARAVKAGAPVEREMAEAAAKLEEAGVPGRALNEGLRKTLNLEQQLQRENVKRALVETAARAPSYGATLGLTAASDLISHGIKRLGNAYPELRWWLNPRNEQVGEIVQALEREGMARKTKRERALVEALAKVPDNERPTVRRFLQAEHSPLEGGYWMPGNDRSRQMFEFKTWDQAGKPPRPGGKARQQSAFVRTDYGEMVRAKKKAEAVALRDAARNIEDGAAAIDPAVNLGDAAIEATRADILNRIAAIDSELDELGGVRQDRVQAAEARVKAILDELTDLDARNAPKAKAKAIERLRVAEEALKREQATDLRGAEKMRAPKPGPGYGPNVPRDVRAGPVVPGAAAERLRAVDGLARERVALEARLGQMDDLIESRRAGRDLGPEQRAERAAELRRQAIQADEWVAKMDGEQRVVNRYGRGLAELSRQATDDAKALGMFENAEQVRQLYWPQVMDRAVREGTIADPLQAMSKSDRKKLNPYLEGSRLRANALRREGVPMTRREAEFGLKTDLAEEALVGLMGFIDDVETYKLYDKIAKSGVALDEGAFLQKRAQAIAEHNARVAAKYRGNPAKIAAEAIDPVNPRGDIPGMDEWIMVPDEARFPEGVRKAAGMTDDAGSPGLKKYGALGGKYIPADLFYDMVNRRAALEEAGTAIAKINQWWKRNKTVRSPATWARNILSSALVFAPMVGMSLWNPRNLGYYADALSDLARGKKSDVYRMAQQDGVFQGTFGRSELGRDYLASQLEGAFNNVTEPMARLFEMVGEAGEAAKTAIEDVKTGAFRRERQTRAKLRDVEDQSQWLRLRQAAPEPKSFAPSRRAWQAAKTSGNALTRLDGIVYGAQDDLFRLAYYRKMIDQAAKAEGVAPTLVSQEARAAAANKAREAFIDYENVPGFAQVLRSPMAPVTREGKSRAGARAAFYLAGQPFIAFSARAIPRMQRWLAEDPLRAQLWMQTSDYLSDINLARSGLTTDEVEAAKGGVRGTSPSSMTATGEIIPGMGRDAEGRIDLLNTGYLSPVSQYAGGKTTRYDSDSAQLWDFMGEVLNIDINPLVRPLAEQMGAVPTFTGQPIVRQGMTPEEERAARLSHLIQAYLPPITPSLSDIGAGGAIGSGPMDRTRIKGGSQYERLAASAAGVPDYQGRERPLSGAVRDVFLGTRGQSVDIDDALVNQTEQAEAKRREVARSAQEATGILVPVSQMRPPQLRAFAAEYRKRLAPLLKVYAEAVEPFPSSRLVRGIKKNLDLLERGTMNDVRWMATADKLFGDALREGIQARTKAKAARTKAAQERNP